MAAAVRGEDRTSRGNHGVVRAAYSPTGRRAMGSAVVGLSTVDFAITRVSLWLHVVAVLVIFAVVFAVGELPRRLTANRRRRAETERK
jgi:hypothetical protein